MRRTATSDEDRERNVSWIIAVMEQVFACLVCVCVCQCVLVRCFLAGNRLAPLCRQLHKGRASPEEPPTPDQWPSGRGCYAPVSPATAGVADTAPLCVRTESGLLFVFFHAVCDFTVWCLSLSRRAKSRPVTCVVR